jgi:VIT1/CCC1 family predicted Fe2+/Mn2+ transporter
VLGANDGLVSNLSLVMGVAGAALSNQIVLITGLAGLISGACSMAMGEWLSVQSSRELYQKQIAAASFFVFMTGAIFPVIPFFVLRGHSAVIASVVVSGLALYATGAVTSIFTGRSVVFSGLRQLAIGLAAASVTFGLGRLLGVSIA